MPVAEGEIFGLLGPNGAGKTTAIECAIGLREPDAGTIRLLGLDPRADRAELLQVVGVQLQASAFPPKLRVGEALDMYRSFCRHPADISELTGALGLAGQCGEFYRSLSGGQRLRLSVVLALIGRPRLAVLDEMTTTTLTLPGTAPAAAFGQLVRNEARLAWRQPTSLIGGLALPAALLVIFSFIPTFRQPQASLSGFSPLDLYVPILIGFSLAMLALFGLPIPLVTYRELGVLRRLSTTPVPPSWLLAAQGVVQLGVALAGLTGILVAGAALGTPAPASPAGFAVAVVLSVAGLFPLGLLIAAMARTANGASVIGRLVLIPMLFFAGLWWPRELMPAVLRDVSDVIPLGAAVEAIQDSMRGAFPPAAPLLVLTGWAVLFGFLAMRFFRWE